VSERFAERQMAKLLRDHMDANGITQAELCRLIGRTPKHVNMVLNGRAGSIELDYWAWALGMRFTVSLVPLDEEQS
jgi:transcriptional regulator with XRE-family HTH domain